jgi:hypothetical protein
VATDQEQLSLPKHKDWTLPLLLSTILQTKGLPSTSSINLD